MDKLKILTSNILNSLTGINFALIGFVAYSSKLVVYGANYPDSIAFIAVCSLYGYNMYLKSKRPDKVRVNSEVQSQINEIQRQLRDTQMQNNLQKRPKFKF